MDKIMVVIGTRPEAIKMGPLIKCMEKESLEVITVTTGQHKEILNNVLDMFEITPAYNLKLLKENQQLEELAARILMEMNPILKKEQPTVVLVHGDTITTFAVALAAFYKKIPVGHVEAGLRTNKKYSPFPEEMNRVLTDDIAELYFAPTEESQRNLINEGHPKEKIFVTGNTGIDALKYTLTDTYNLQKIIPTDPNKKMILVTMHRRENWGAPMDRVFQTINRLTSERKDIEFLFSVHPNPIVRDKVFNYFDHNSQVHIVDALDVVGFHNVMNASYMILTDSGGIQEEAPSMGKPVLVLRDTTERPEGVAAGTLKLVSTDPQKIYENVIQLLDDKDAYNKMAERANPYGTGYSSEVITTILKKYMIEKGNEEK